MEASSKFIIRFFLETDVIPFFHPQGAGTDFRCDVGGPDHHRDDHHPDPHAGSGFARGRESVGSDDGDGIQRAGVLAGTADTHSLHRDCRHAFPHVCRERDGDLAFKRPWSGGLHFPPVVVCVAGPVCRHRAGAADLALDQSAGA